MTQADLQLQRAMAGTLARDADPAAASAGPGAASAVPAAVTAGPADPAAQERAAFFAGCPRVLADHVPSTHIGRFDVRLEPPHMTLTVKVRFVPAGRWTPEEQAAKLPAFQDQWFATVSGFWRPGMFTFWSQRPGWEDLWVTVIPEFRLAEPGEKEHVLVNVHKGKVGSHVDNARHVAEFGTEDNVVRERAKGRRATSTHEAGHLLGLGEEYVDGGAESTNIEAAHSKLAERQLGHKVYLGATDSIMSSGGRVLPQHSVTMREALEKVAAPYVDWGLTRRAARR
jgi:hypothetical protein